MKVNPTSAEHTRGVPGLRVFLSRPDVHDCQISGIYGSCNTELPERFPEAINRFIFRQQVLFQEFRVVIFLDHHRLSEWRLRLQETL